MDNLTSSRGFRNLSPSRVKTILSPNTVKKSFKCEKTGRNLMAAQRCPAGSCVTQPRPRSQARAWGLGIKLGGNGAVCKSGVQDTGHTVRRQAGGERPRGPWGRA